MRPGQPPSSPAKIPCSIYGTILKAPSAPPGKSWTTWENVAILLGISLAVTPASRCASGTLAARDSSFSGGGRRRRGLKLKDSLPQGVVLILMCLAGMAAAGVYVPWLRC